MTDHFVSLVHWEQRTQRVQRLPLWGWEVLGGCGGGNQFSLRLTPSFTCNSQQEAEGKISVLGIISHGGEGDGRGGGPWKTGCSVEFGQDGCAVILKLL